MEPRFGHDFSQVRIHNDTQAAETAQAVHARAYTLGRDIVFGAGQYAPETITGKNLLAHELTHVVQQGGLVSSSKNMNSSNDMGERDANHIAPSILTSSSTSLIQREEEGTSPPAGGKPPKSDKSSTTPCPTSVRIGQITQRNHSDLPDDRKSTTRTYLSARTHMDVGPGPNHLGHCMKETVTVLHSNCPEAMFTKDKKQKHPCTGDKCLVIGDYNSGPSAFIDTHFTKAPVSLLEGIPLKECSVTCEQTYSCDRKYPATGTFLITRNFKAETYTGKDGKEIHVTTGTVTKTKK